MIATKPKENGGITEYARRSKLCTFERFLKFSPRFDVFPKPISEFFSKLTLSSDRIEDASQESELRKILYKYESDSNTLGIFLFGSLSLNKEHPKSDIDLCVIINIGMEMHIDEEMNELNFSITLRPLVNFEYSFYNNIEWAIDQLRYSKALYDPYKVIEKLVRLSREYQIPKESAITDLHISVEALDSAEDLIDTGDVEGSNYCISYAATKAVRAFLKAKQILYSGPKYLCEQLRNADAEVYLLFCGTQKTESPITTRIEKIQMINKKTFDLLRQ